MLVNNDTPAEVNDYDFDEGLDKLFEEIKEKRKYRRHERLRTDLEENRVFIKKMTAYDAFLNNYCLNPDCKYHSIGFKNLKRKCHECGNKTFMSEYRALAVMDEDYY